MLLKKATKVKIFFVSQFKNKKKLHIFAFSFQFSVFSFFPPSLRACEAIQV